MERRTAYRVASCKLGNLLLIRRTSWSARGILGVDYAQENARGSRPARRCTVWPEADYKQAQPHFDWQENVLPQTRVGRQARGRYFIRR